MSIYITKEKTQEEILKELHKSGAFSRFIINPMSRIYTLVRALSNAIHIFVNEKMLRIQQATHPHTSIHPQDIALWEDRLNIKRKEATHAHHIVRIGKKNKPDKDLLLSQNLTIKTKDGVRFMLIASYVLPKSISQDSNSYYTIEAECAAEIAGTGGNVIAFSISEIENAPEGIDVVYNPNKNPSSPGQNKETITELRKRFRDGEVTSSEQMWTRDWYISQAISKAEIYRAFFDSAIRTKQMGLTRLWVTGKYGDVPQVIIDQLYNELNYEENKVSGFGVVQVFPLERKDVTRHITIYVEETGYLPNGQSIRDIIDKFFLSLGRGENFISNSLKSAFFVLPGIRKVVIEPDINVVCDNNQIIGQGIGLSFSIEVEK